MRDPYVPRSGPPRRGARRWRPSAALASLAVAAGIAASAFAAPGPTMEMRRARFALARGAEGDAIAALEAVRREAPGSPRGLEAALLLADLHFSNGRSPVASGVLADAASAAPAGSRAAIDLARGWLALASGEGDAARARFAEARTSDVALARDVAEIGHTWVSLAIGGRATNLDALEQAARHDGPLATRFAASWTLSKALAHAGEHRRALREIRRLRRDVRGTEYEDDLELLLGLAQLEAGRAKDARRTFKRLERRTGAGRSRSPIDTGLRFEDLRASSAGLVARVGALYAERSDRSVGLLPFLGALLDRDAGRDASWGVLLAERAIAAKKGGNR